MALAASLVFLLAMLEIIVSTEYGHLGSNRRPHLHGLRKELQMLLCQATSPKNKLALLFQAVLARSLGLMTANKRQVACVPLFCSAVFLGCEVAPSPRAEYQALVVVALFGQ